MHIPFKRATYSNGANVHAHTFVLHVVSDVNAEIVTKSEDYGRSDLAPIVRQLRQFATVREPQRPLGHGQCHVLGGTWNTARAHGCASCLLCCRGSADGEHHGDGAPHVQAQARRRLSPARALTRLVPHP